jgi:uncharacterized protein (DUF302 family)
VLTYELAEPWETAVRTVRSALKRHGLRAALDMDVAARIRNELGAGVAPCFVLYVDDPAVLLEAMVFNRAAALMIPQPVVITGDRDPLLDLLRRISRTMESIAEKHGVHLAISS